MATTQATANLTEQNQHSIIGKRGAGSRTRGPTTAAGGDVGRSVADEVDPITEEAYWRETCPTRRYYDATIPIDMYLMAYRYGWEARVLYDDMHYADMERVLRHRWNGADNGDGRHLTWEKAKHAIHDAWERVTNAFRARARAQRSR